METMKPSIYERGFGVEGKKRGFSCFTTKIKKILNFKKLIDFKQILINCNYR
jgi:hypothetical protein